VPGGPKWRRWHGSRDVVSVSAASLVSDKVPDGDKGAKATEDSHRISHFRPVTHQPTTGCFARPKERYYLIARYTRTDLGTDCRTLIMNQRPPYRRQVINPVCHVKPKAP